MPTEQASAMNLTITYEQADWLEFQTWLEKKIAKTIKSTQDHFLINLIIWAIIAAGSMSMFARTSHFHWPSAAYALGLCALLFTAYIRHMTRLRKAFTPSKQGSFIGTHHFRVSEQGIHSEGHGYHCHHQWSAILRLERGNGLIMLFVDTANALIFPERQLQDPDAFFDYLKTCKQNANAADSNTQDQPPAKSEPN